MTDIKVAAQVRQHIGKDRGPLQALALNLARRIDAGGPGTASLAKELRATLREIDLEHVGSEDDRIRQAVEAALAAERARHDEGEGTPDAAKEVEPGDDVSDLESARARRVAAATARHPS